MHITPAHIIGYTAGTLTTLAFIPQLVFISNTNQPRPSWVTLVVQCLGVSTWILYGITVRDHVIVIFNTASLLLLLFYTCLILFLNSLPVEADARFASNASDVPRETTV